LQGATELQNCIPLYKAQSFHMLFTP
jgi:hypothetical protein